MTTLSSPRPQGFEAPDFGAMRQAMVSSQLRTNAVNDPRVVLAMGRVPRERFVPEDERAFAYLDRQVALGRGRHLNVPVSTGRLLTEAYLEPEDQVLLIGAATGYTAAVLAELVADVVAIESDPALVAHAEVALQGEAKVQIIEAPLRSGWSAGGPYDVLMIDGAVEFVPDELLEQVKPDGRVVTGLVDRNVIRLASGRRSRGGFGLVAFADMDCVVLPGFSRPRRFTF